MQIFIMRHGQASFQADSDEARALTKQGTLEAELMGQWLAKMDVNPDTIIVSPYIRAQQTCQQVIKALAGQYRPQTLSLITPSGRAADVRDYLDGEIAVKPISQLLLVSHMPIVSYLVDEYTQHEKAPVFQTAGICEIDYDVSTMKGEFIRLVSPIDLC